MCGRNKKQKQQGYLANFHVDAFFFKDIAEKGYFTQYYALESHFIWAALATCRSNSYSLAAKPSPQKNANPFELAL
jgi:hypothetical protein